MRAQSVHIPHSRDFCRRAGTTRGRLARSAGHGVAAKVHERLEIHVFAGGGMRGRLLRKTCTDQ